MVSGICNEPRTWAEGARGVRDCGIDWLTTVLTDGDAIDCARPRMRALQQEAERNGEYRKAWGTGGHRGTACGGIAWAEAKGSAIAQVSSQAAVGHADVLFSLGGRLSRLDLQLTVWVDPTGPNPALEAYGANPKNGRSGRRVSHRTLIQGSDGGVTCYMGSPQSEHRMRLYDKGVEEQSAPAGELFRWELQSRRDWARTLGKTVEQPLSRQSAVACAVCAYSGKVGAPMPEASVPFTSINVAARVHDAAATLRWLKSSVSPAIRRLEDHYSRDQILKALGLAHWRSSTVE